MSKQTIVLTGTHITPALALIEKLKRNDFKTIYFGRHKSMFASDQIAAENQLLAKTKVELKTIRTPKFSRHQPLRSFLALIFFPLSVFKAVYFIRKVSPKLVVSFGGYVALPVCLAAKLWRIPLLVHEQTMHGGLTNLLTAKLADVVAVSFSQSLAYFPKGKTVLTGNPLRNSIIKSKLKTNKKGKQVLYITGGNQGSRTINHVAISVLPQLLQKYEVYHQFGLTQTEREWQENIKIKSKNYHLQRWFSDQQLVKILRRKPLVLSRAGVNTVTELAFLGLKSVLIPLPITQKNEQMNNALWLKKFGLAVILPQKDLTTTTLLDSLKKAERLVAKPVAISTHATQNLYLLAIKLLKKGD
jgi:UDP-N-acetylglucosamine--N-acetylmuramyl-(pentapeptide) pyrophosphoryl-undecaprenol N-acetylglucosamine transferase